MRKEEKKEYRSISWQLELFISGGVLYALYESTDFLKYFFYHKYPIIEFTTVQMVLLCTCYVITRALLLGFGANLLLRTVWLAYGGIEFWHPQTIDPEDGTDMPSNPRLDRLDKWANLSFSAAILFTLVTLSMALVVTTLIFFINHVLGFPWLTDYSDFVYGLVIVVTLLQLGFFGFATKSKKKRTLLGKLGQGLGRLHYFASGAFLYAPEMRALQGRKSKLTLLLSGAVYLCLAIVISINQVGKYYPFGTFTFEFLEDRKYYDIRGSNVYNSVYYNDNIGENSVSFYGCIQSEIIKDKHLKLFIPSWNHFDKYLRHAMDSLDYSTTYDYSNIDSVRAKEIVYRKNSFNKILTRLFEVRIDDAIINPPTWYRYTHPKTREEGYVTYILCDSLSIGHHLLKVDNRFINWKGEVHQGNWINIPFWKE
ncbi:MAG: hypothetical protein WBG71_15210 [Leeuwenhoekiella sp.]